MEENINKMLDDEIRNRLLELKTLEPGSKETESAVNNLTKLYELRLMENKNLWEIEERFETRVNEENLKREQLELDIKNFKCRLVLESASILLPMAFYAVWMNKGLKFEETGVLTSSTFRNLWSRFRSER